MKKNVKARNPRNVNDLKKFTIKEFNKFLKKYLENQFKNFIRRCKKIIGIKGGRLKPVHLNQIRKEEEEENKEKKEEESKEEEEEEELKLKIIFNEETLKKNAKKEISFLRKKIKAEKK